MSNFDLSGVPLDPRILMPCFVVNMNYVHCFMDANEELGPTQFVPGSRRNKHAPDNPSDDNLNYEGQQPIIAVDEVGDVALWHRGLLNRSLNRYRLIQQCACGKRFIAQHFYPFVNYHLPKAILECANPRRQRLLDIHPRGAYG